MEDGPRRRAAAAARTLRHEAELADVKADSYWLAHQTPEERQAFRREMELDALARLMRQPPGGR